MAFDISFESNLRDWTASLTDVQLRQLPFATALALNLTAGDVRNTHKGLLPQIFDRPTRFTLNSLYYVGVSKRSNEMVSTVRFKDSSRSRAHYLMPQVEGGARPHKRFEKWLINRGIMTSDEFAVPAKGVKLDSSGNLSAGTVTQILSQLNVSPDAMQWETEKSRKRAGASRSRYFVPREGSKLKRGVWMRKGKTISPVLIFVTGTNYQIRYRFYDISAREASARFPIRFEEAMIKALATAR